MIKNLNNKDFQVNKTFQMKAKSNSCKEKCITKLMQMAFQIL